MDKLPPNPSHATLKRIYPWDEYNKTLIVQWLYLQAQKTGFTGTIEDFEIKYGLYSDDLDPSYIYDLIEKYSGNYTVIPQANLDQILRTDNKLLEDDIVIEKIPYAEVSNTAGGTTVIIG